MPTIKASMRENSVTTDSADIGSGSSSGFTDVSNSWTTRPSDGLPFTKTDIDNLQIGTLLHGSNFGANTEKVSQVYVVIDYTLPVSSTGFFAFFRVPDIKSLWQKWVEKMKDFWGWCEGLPIA